METLLSFLIFIGILVIFHEFGHFVFAKLFSVKVETFSIGLGPAIFRKKIGETEFQIALIPLGGYVKLFGENLEEAKENPEKAFHFKKPWQKILIAFGGPLFNFILALFGFWIYYMLPHKVPKVLLEEPKVEVIEKNSLAEKLNIKKGDIIEAINGIKVKSWKELNELLPKFADKEITITIRRGEQKIKLKTKLALKDIVKGLGISFNLPNIIGRVKKGSPAYEVGLKPGDKIIAINGIKVNSWIDFLKVRQKFKGEEPLTLTIERNGKVFNKTIIPQKLGQRYILGISPKMEYVEIRYSVGTAFKKAWEKVISISILTIKSIKDLITGNLSLDYLGGPFTIANFANEAVRAGLATFLAALSAFSVELAIFNLIPLPILDGGLIILFFLEWIYRKPLPPSFKEWWTRIGLALLIAILLFSISLDIRHFFSKS
jgi:regulator of sigma E protease